MENFEQLLQAAKDLPAIPIAGIDADERHLLEGACKAAEQGHIDPVPVGDEGVLRNLLPDTNGAGQFRIIHAPRDGVMAEKGDWLIEKSEVKALLQGLIHTDPFVHPVLIPTAPDITSTHSRKHIPVSLSFRLTLRILRANCNLDATGTIALQQLDEPTDYSDAT